MKVYNPFFKNISLTTQLVKVTGLSAILIKTLNLYKNEKNENIIKFSQSLGPKSAQ